MTTSSTPSAREPGAEVQIQFEGHRYAGVRGQTVAGILLGNGVRAWRTTSAGERPRGAFCGIGVCFDCLVTVDGQRDVRACLRRPEGGELVTRQHDLLPGRQGEDADNDC
ncbi:(2Fe-2S)-binding protein [Nocardioides sp. InS609-2]|uniref:(2Fe-2S)-binding protein n=1 Tax=Nocardioides sp. InS609-2 TaxID=2760705 RepID=UPI0020C046C5|nr:(2Fe-2S)-binding protein [Nocardioides sp. InS609-2]